MLGRLSLFILLAGAAFSGAWLTHRSSRTGTEVHFVSVGQGNCTVILHEDWVVLVDTGPRRDGYDAGDRIVVPALRKLGVRKIDVIVLTHPDADHAGGLSQQRRQRRSGRRTGVRLQGRRRTVAGHGVMVRFLIGLIVGLVFALMLFGSLLDRMESEAESE